MAGEVFNKPVPKEALAYFNSKDLKIGFDYRDVWRAEHAYSFTVAKAMTVDILEDIQGAVSKAIAEGKTYHQFQKELKPILQQKGWWGRKSMRDPLTGEIKDVQLGSLRRLKTIYRANMRTARAAGKWERIQRTKEALPYLLYQLGPAERHRPIHASWNGIMLPVDHPFWQTHYTPNGWGCKCWIRQASKNEYTRLGEQEGYITTAPPVDNESWLNKRTGVIEQVPKGIDAGWNTNAGLVRQITLDRALLDKSYVGDAFMQTVIGSEIRKQDYRNWISNTLKAAKPFGVMATVTTLNEREAQFLKSKNLEPEKLIAVEDTVLVNSSLSEKQWQALPESLKNAETIVFDADKNELLYIIDSTKKPQAVTVGFNNKSRAAEIRSIDDFVEHERYQKIK